MRKCANFAIEKLTADKWNVFMHFFSSHWCSFSITFSSVSFDFILCAIILVLFWSLSTSGISCFKSSYSWTDIVLNCDSILYSSRSFGNKWANSSFTSISQVSDVSFWFKLSELKYWKESSLDGFRNHNNSFNQIWCTDTYVRFGTAFFLKNVFVVCLIMNFESKWRSQIYERRFSSNGWCSRIIWIHSFLASLILKKHVKLL